MFEARGGSFSFFQLYITQPLVDIFSYGFRLKSISAKQERRGFLPWPHASALHWLGYLINSPRNYAIVPLANGPDPKICLLMREIIQYRFCLGSSALALRATLSPKTYYRD
jgi:hypothetical protein